jgi:hypothetical protein
MIFCIFTINISKKISKNNETNQVSLHVTAISFMFLAEDKYEILDYLSKVIDSQNYLFDSFIYQKKEKFVSLNNFILTFDFRSIFSKSHFSVKNNIYNVPWKPIIPVGVEDVNNFDHFCPFELIDEQIASNDGLINALWHLDKKVCDQKTVILIKADSNIFYRFYCVFLIILKKSY